MAALDDFKEKLREQIQTTIARVQESTAWGQLMERYQSLSPNAQKLSLAGVGATVALLLFLLPWLFFSGASSSLAEFEEKKQLIRDLFRYSHAATTLPPAPPMMSSGDLRGAVQNVLAGQNPTLLPEQTVSINEFDNSKTKSGALPQSLTQSGLAVSLSRLNLDQIVKIGGQLQELRPTVKMVGLKVQSTAADPHYFDVTFKMVAFNLPLPPEPPAKPGTKGAAKPGAKKEE